MSTVEKNPTYCSRSAINEMLKSQELVYDNYKPFFSQSFMNARNKACRDHSCVEVSLQENWLRSSISIKLMALQYLTL